MTPIEVRCPECDATLKIKPAQAGKSLRCPRCKTVLPAVSMEGTAVRPSSPPPLPIDDADPAKDRPPNPSRRTPEKKAAQAGILAPIMVVVCGVAYVSVHLGLFLGLWDGLLLGDTSLQDPRQNLLQGFDGPGFKKPIFHEPDPEEDKLAAPDPNEAAIREAELRAKVEALGIAERKQIALRNRKSAADLVVRTFPLPDGVLMTRRIGVSADGKWLVMNTMKSLLVWDAHSGELKWTLADSDLVNDFAIAPDSHTLAGAYGSKIMLWNLRNGQPFKTLSSNKNNVSRIVFSPDGRTLVGVGLFSGPLIWETQTGQLVVPPELRAASYQAVCFTPDGRSLIVSNSSGGTFEGKVLAIDLKSGRKTARLAKESRGGGHIAISSNGKYLAISQTETEE